MTLLVSLAQFLPVVLFLLAAAALGFGLLDLARVRAESDLEAALFACGAGFFVIQIAVFVLSVPGWLNRGTAWAVLVAVSAAAGPHWKRVWGCVTGVMQGARRFFATQDAATRATFAAIAAVAVFEELLASAPLTGSDAMHYHFTVPLLQMSRPLAPVFDLTNSFLIGQAHLLISLGLALGSDRIALEFIFLGGLLTALGLFAIARRLMPQLLALIATLTFLLTPMVFWQITTSGSPDIWMGFYVALTLLAAARGMERGDSRLVLLAGFFSGNAAGVKYTGWIVPIVLCGYLLASFRPRRTAFFASLLALAGGGLPLARNVLWTGDPVFPFLLRWLNPAHVNRFALAALLANTRSSLFSLAPQRLFAFPLALALNGNSLGLGQYFGPLVLAFAPLLVFIDWKSPLVKLCGVMWLSVFAANAVTTQMGRFLLPIYAIALLLAFSGVAELLAQGWHAAARACAVTVGLFLAFACGADAVYAKNFLPVVIGREGRLAFLQRMAPDFQFATFVNGTVRALAASSDQNTMVFFRHLFYLRVPDVNGDPSTSWSIDPAKCSGETAVLRCLRDEHVRWVVTAPDFPEALAGGFTHLVVAGQLVPVAKASLESLAGATRLESTRESVDVTIWELRDALPSQ